LCATNRRPQFSSTKNHNVQDHNNTAAFPPLFPSTSGVGVGGFIGPPFRHVKRLFEKKFKFLKKVQNGSLDASPDQPSYACQPQKSSVFGRAQILSSTSTKIQTINPPLIYGDRFCRNISILKKEISQNGKGLLTRIESTAAWHPMILSWPRPCPIVRAPASI
jgi:hypothetical protein